MVEGLARHLDAAVRLRLPGDYVRLFVGGAAVGFVRPAVAEVLDGGADGVRLADAAALAAAEERLVRESVFRRRGEAFDVRAQADGAVLGTVDRGALPVLGIEAQGVHVNGLVGNKVWIGRRAAGKVEGGKLDHMVAGGIPAGMDAMATLVKEAAEEASVPEKLARRARRVGTLSYAMARAEGLRRDRLHCLDLEVPEDFTPVPGDDEVVGFALRPIADVLEEVRDTGAYKFNVNFVLIDLFARRGLVDTSPALEQMRDA